MKFKVSKKFLPFNLIQALRRAGYSYQKNKQGQIGFVRRLSRQQYPRFHLYIKEGTEEIYFDLHLDQKRASYQNIKPHSAEHNSTIVKNETKRLKKFFNF